MNNLPPGTYAELKRGRKPCISCDAIIGAGRKKCPACGVSFGTSKPVKVEVKEVEKPAAAIPGAGREGAQEIVIIPAGSCPIVLDNTRKVNILAWMDSVAAHWRYHQRGTMTLLSVEALEWWAREFFPYKSREHNRIVMILREATDGDPVMER